MPAGLANNPVGRPQRAVPTPKKPTLKKAGFLSKNPEKWVFLKKTLN